jgi:hypothetical protein
LGDKRTSATSTSQKTAVRAEGKLRRRRSNLELTMPERASAVAVSLQGRLGANNMRGGGKARNTGAREMNFETRVSALYKRLVIHLLRRKTSSPKRVALGCSVAR